MDKKVEWQGRYLRAVRDRNWEYVERCGDVHAVVILAEHDGRVVLVEQERVPLGRRCLELPAGLVGDEDDKSVEDTAIKELEEETGFTAARIERLGEFVSSPGITSEGFILVRAHGLSKIGDGGGVGDERIEVHLVTRGQLAGFVAERRAAGVAVDAKMLLVLAGALLG
ncbi:MAG: NUDIX hydrolase [Sphingomonas bacterium]|nr:NUDIX hydrolase [Sphingomonas bacterium]